MTIAKRRNSQGDLARISAGDETDLRKFFRAAESSEAGGWCVSHFGSMLERAELYAMESQGCEHCGGLRELIKVTRNKRGYVIATEVTQEAKAGSGIVQPGPGQ